MPWPPIVWEGDKESFVATIIVFDCPAPAQASETIRALIQDLLTCSRIGTRGKPPAPTDCEQIFNQVVRNLGSAISEAGAVITHDPLPTVLGDDARLMQVFQNLIGNSVKFRRDEPPKVHVSVAKNDGECVFSVKDNGMGIESRYADRIFAIFQRLNKRREHDGTGIGLPISRKWWSAITGGSGWNRNRA